MDCGLEVQGFLRIDSGYTENVPLFIGYSRLKRFRCMLMAILKPIMCSLDSRTQAELGDQMFDNVPDMIKAIKKTKSKNKQYSSIHLYATKYVGKHTSPRIPLLNKIEEVLSDFTKLEVGHSLKYKDAQFFSYRWALARLLEKHNLHDFVIYVKKLQNKTSIENYKRMYNCIMNEDNVEVDPGKPSMCVLSSAESRDDVSEHFFPWSLF